jgi:hypothetical protein
MPKTERDQTVVEEPFSLTVDQYGRLWLHTKLSGVEVALDLAAKEDAFDIMAQKMAEYGFEHRAIVVHQDADNDDQRRN